MYIYTQKTDNHQNLELGLRALELELAFDRIQPVNKTDLSQPSYINGTFLSLTLFHMKFVQNAMTTGLYFLHSIIHDIF